MTSPSPTDLFWTHIPSWAWPLIILGVLGFFLVQVIRASETVARVFGWPGRKIHNSASNQRTQRQLARIEDTLDCALTYLVADQEYHDVADLLIATHYPGVTHLLPTRIPFAEHQRRWREGWRPVGQQES